MRNGGAKLVAATKTPRRVSRALLPAKQKGTWFAKPIRASATLLASIHRSWLTSARCYFVEPDGASGCFQFETRRNKARNQTETIIRQNTCSRDRW